MGSRRTEVAVGTLAGLTAANAIGGAVYGVRGAPDVSREWLTGSPFRDYSVPSVVLGTAVGGTAGAASLAAWRADEHAGPAAMLARGVLVAWIAAQVRVIGLRSPLQPAMAAVGVALVALGRRLS
jgi:hypothetical protein